MPQLYELVWSLLIDCVAAVDALPVYIRAFFAGLLLCILLRFFESRIRAEEVLYSISFRKTAFVVLLIIPLLVVLFPVGRVVVFVDELPQRSSSIPWGWLLLLLIWASGFIATTGRLIHSYLNSYRKLKSLPTISADNKLTARLHHWQQQLGITLPLTLVQGTGPAGRRLPGSRQIVVPASALHWPAGSQDVLLIRELCELKVHHHAWHCLAQTVACCYWPLTWVPRMHNRMSADFHLAADALAESCYRDPLGYDRALQQIARNQMPATASRAESATDASVTRMQQLLNRLQRYRDAVASLWQPETIPELDFEQLFAARAIRDRQRKTEPYDKVFWFIGQAVFVALLVSGPTLRQTPPEIEQDFALPFEVLWMENFHRNQEREEHQLPPVEGSRIPPKKDSP